SVVRCPLLSHYSGSSHRSSFDRLSPRDRLRHPLANNGQRTTDQGLRKLELGAVGEALEHLAESVRVAVAAGVEGQSAGVVAEVILEQELDERLGGAVRRQRVAGRPGNRVERR